LSEVKFGWKFTLHKTEGNSIYKTFQGAYVMFKHLPVGTNVATVLQTVLAKIVLLAGVVQSMGKYK
jgi:hypothetical protein